ncbi:MAG: RNA 2',3'-cyclic phosphodiesterase [Gemmatimonadales bacterium]
MRLFAAVPVPDPARTQIAELLGRLRGSGWPVRWIHDESVHVTLKFFGEVAPERLEVIEEAVRFAAQGTGALPLRLADLGAFPNQSRPRVLWMGLDGPAALELLQDRLERGCEAIGFPPEGAPFQPHITLGRVKEGQRCPPRALEEFGEAYQRVPFVGSQLVLYESVLTTRGPRYEPRLTLELAE